MPGTFDQVPEVNELRYSNLIGLARYGRDGKDGIRTRFLDSSNLIDWIRRRAEGNGEFEYGATVARPAILGCPVEIAIAALHQPGGWTGSIVRGADKGVKIRVAAAGTDPKHGAVVVRPAKPLLQFCLSIC
jgi:hypothetical protein